MYSHTVRNFIKLLYTHTGSNKYCVEFQGEQTSNYYKFRIDRDKPLSMVVYDKDRNELLLTEVGNLDTISFPDKRFKPYYLEERQYTNKGEEFEITQKHIAYPAQLYITLFKRLQRKANLVFEYKGEQRSAYYIEGKVILTEENNEDKKTKITITNLNRLNTLFPNYNILFVSPMLHWYSFKQYLDTQEEIVRLKGHEVESIRHDRKTEEG